MQLGVLFARDRNRAKWVHHPLFEDAPATGICSRC
jgi:hypothetical protein